MIVLWLKCLYVSGFHDEFLENYIKPILSSLHPVLYVILLLVPRLIPLSEWKWKDIRVVSHDGVKEMYSRVRLL